MRDSEKVTYLNIMTDTLKKKDILLNELKTITLDQAQILEKEEFGTDEFDKTIDQKQTKIDELLKLDDGFMEMYEKVKDTLINDGKEYAAEIEQAKALIIKQTDTSMELQALEEKNRLKLSVHLAKGHQKGKDFRISSRTAAAYYKNMSNRHQDGDSYFLDSKK
ncbi:MAG: hypothetical protein K6E47_02015 [Lachnospiraceae bacterium]|nr:hypothetical protein [Lachnospiraceae bacterium]